MKKYHFFSLIFVFSFLLLSCEKEALPQVSTPDIEIELPAMLIQTEACFTTDAITLILAHPDDNFYYEDDKKYQIDWYQNNKFIKSNHRIDCVGNGHYRVQITFAENGKTEKLNYKVDLGDEQ